MPIILALGRQRQENHEFEASLGCMSRPCLKKTIAKRKKIKTRLSYDPAISLLGVYLKEIV
jgi:hypothetical protein